MPQARLPLSTVLAYGLPAMPAAALTLPLYVVVPTFYSETLGLPLAAVGAVLIAVRLFDALNDPAFGWIGDRLQSGFGRRRLMVALSLPVTAFAAWKLFAPPPDAGLGYLALWMALLTGAFSALLLAWSAWGAELAGDYRERSRITGWRESFTVLGTLAAIAIPFVVAGAQDRAGLAVLGAAVAAGLLAFGGVAVLAVPEPRNHSVTRLTLKASLRAMAGNRPFLRLIAAYFANGLANGIPATLFLYFVSARLGEPDLRGPLLFLYFLCGLGGVPAATALAARIGKHRAWSLAMLLACVVFSAVPLIGAGDVAAFAAVCVLTGFVLGFDLSLPPSIQADVIDADTAVSGEQRSGIYFAAWSLATKLSLAAGVGIAFPLLALAGFDPQAGAGNAPGAMLALAVLYAWVPVALKLVAIALMWSFPFDETAQRAARTAIETRQA
ncbi:MFS transporter [Zhengella mangrovi]|uniref:MFS transporter n=1 Tax=Zhengella mangrovi TaxID=1982044 RepID=A0A2G1QR76_9HYPH|nr:MFS transporter [Zhengella mangrovi]PHP68023.1 MFS transporter [Zhengella mangrovi]